MKQKYIVPTTTTAELNSQSLLAASQPLNKTEDEAKKEYEVLSNKFDPKQFDWE